MVEGSPDPIRLGGCAVRLADQIETATKLETRSTILGHIQRGGAPSSFDRVLATRFGYHALELAVNGVSGKLVVWRDGKIGEVDITSVAGKQRKIPLDHPLLATARAVGTNFGD